MLHFVAESIGYYVIGVHVSTEYLVIINRQRWFIRQSADSHGSYHS